MFCRLVGTTAPGRHDCLIQELKVCNHGSIPITIDCNVVAFIVFEEGFHQPIKRTKQSGIFDVKDSPHTGRPVVINVDKITEIIEVAEYDSSRSIAQELNIDHKSILNLLRKVGFKKKLNVWVPHEFTTKRRRIELPSAKTWPNGMKSTHFLSGW
ncbi:histone-lysine N-methyltransferase SETMAR [Trichonephila clavipes]|nr:histone-lysine N-methyltransferase SETMAR [Trichonephila clavipes]